MTDVTCKNHPESAAVWRCAACEASFCQACVIDSPGIPPVALCKVCGGRCASLAGAGAPGRPGAGAPKSFYAELPRSFLYGLSPKALGMNAMATAMLYLLSLVPLPFFLVWIVGLFVGGYLCAYMLSLIRASAKGDDEVPNWPEFTDPWEDIVKPFLLVLVVSLLPFLPVLIYRFSTWDFPWGLFHEPDAVCHALQIAGILYLPMAKLAIAQFGSFVAMNPLFIFGAIVRVPLEYFCVYLMYVGVYGVRVSLYSLTAQLGPVGAILALLFPLYFLMVDCRVLGVLYAANSEKLRWFAKD